MHRNLTLLIAGLWTGIVPVSNAAIQDGGTGAGDEWTVPVRAARKKNPSVADEFSVAQGKALYARECLSCHGATGRGDGPAAKDLEKTPGDLSSPKLWEQTDGALFFKITEGRQPMPSMQTTFTEEERWHVINYLRTFAPRPKQWTRADDQRKDTP